MVMQIFVAAAVLAAAATNDSSGGSIGSLSIESVLAPVAGVAPTVLSPSAPSQQQQQQLLPLRVSWVLTSEVRGDMQMFYELVVGGVSSGKVAWSNASPTGGVPLPSALTLEADTKYSFAVRSYLKSAKGTPTLWANSSFSTGLFGEAAWHGAAWIGSGQRDSDSVSSGNNLWFRKEFTLSTAVAEVRLHVAHSGFYKCKVGRAGQKAATAAGDYELGASTNFWARLYYDSYEVPEISAAGDYVLTCLVGAGRYGELRNGLAGRVCRAGQHSHGPSCPPGIRVLLSADSRAIIISNSSWTAAPSPVTSSDFFGGESYDAGLLLPGFELPGFSGAASLTKAAINGSGFVGPFATIPLLSSFRLPPVRVIQVNPRIDSWPSAHAHASEIFDFGVNSAAIVEFRVPIAACPLTLHLQFAEAIHQNGSLYHHITGPSSEISTFTCAARPSLATDEQKSHIGAEGWLMYRSHWTQMGYRYAEVTQTAGHNFSLSTLNISSLSVSTGFDSRKDSSFECSHKLTNLINNATRVTARSNFISFPTDCEYTNDLVVGSIVIDTPRRPPHTGPQRERAGWLGDAHVGSETVFRNYDASGAYRLFVEMIAESLDKEGNPPDVVPFLGGHGAYHRFTRLCFIRTLIKASL
jgi:hypothetical protein